jgi:tetratricopeptide (TPR) repeat protein
MYELAIQDFTTILQARPDDVHGRFSRGMAFFKLGHVEKANLDFTQVLQLNPNHVMARYARAGCYNTEGEFYQAIEDYTIALQYDEQENENGSFNVHKKRLYLHENAEKLIHEKLGATGPRGARNSITNSNIKSQSIQITPFSFSVYSPMPSTTGTSDVLHALTQSHSVSPQRAMTTMTPVRIAKIRLDVDDIEENNNRNNCSGSSGNNNDNNTGPATRPVPLRKPSSQRVVPKVVVNLREEIEEKQKQDRVEQTQISFITSPSAVEKKWQKTLQIAHEALGIRPETVQISTTSTNTADTSNTTATSASSDNNNNTEMTPNVKGLQQSQSTPTLVRRVQIVL